MADIDFATCDRPDELIRLAWSAGLDRKAVIRAGAGAAGLLLATERNGLITLFWPVPRPLEAVDRWCENGRARAGPAGNERMRPNASAVVPGCVLGAVATQWFVAPHLSRPHAELALLLICLASSAVLGVVFRAMIEATLRRRTARLDEEAALAIVLEQLRLGMVTSAALAPRACVWIRRDLAPKP